MLSTAVDTACAYRGLERSATTVPPRMNTFEYLGMISTPYTYLHAHICLFQCPKIRCVCVHIGIMQIALPTVQPRVNTFEFWTWYL
jgi:hypothetical protein